MIDLAGSERAATTHNRGLRLKEGVRSRDLGLEAGQFWSLNASSRVSLLLLFWPFAGNCLCASGVAPVAAPRYLWW